MFIEVKKKQKPETKKYEEINKQKNEKFFKFKEVLPFGGMIYEKRAKGKNFKHTFDATRSEPLSHLINNPNPIWNPSKNVSLYFSPMLISRDNL